MIISGKTIADEIQEEIRIKIERLTGRPPGLTMILVGNHPASAVYVNMKRKACSSVGIASNVISLPENITQEELLKTILKLNQDPLVDGILLQSPLPPHLNMPQAFSTIDPHKDVDGFHPMNMGKLLLGDPDGFIPCTPLGVMELLKRSNLSPKGMHAVVVGRSNIVGKPLSALLLQADATVTVAHSKTKNLPEITKTADLLIAALGKPRFITEEMVKKGAVVIDVGINREENPDNKIHIVGDVDFENVASKCSAITPVPRGVGPMTVAMLLQNTLQSFERKCKHS
jgi:methylenetetrahydrofolate dehydrogenase (NADP+)/methenyltetrahydrofolate cyclohydrolase